MAVSTPKTLPERFRERFPPDWDWSAIPHDLPPRYNIAPSSHCVVVREGEDTPTAAMQIWAFRPHWMKQRSKAQINARAEGMFTSSMFALICAPGALPRRLRRLLRAEGKEGQPAAMVSLSPRK